MTSGKISEKLPRWNQQERTIELSKITNWRTLLYRVRNWWSIHNRSSLRRWRNADIQLWAPSTAWCKWSFCFNFWFQSQHWPAYCVHQIFIHQRNNFADMKMICQINLYRKRESFETKFVQKISTGVPLWKQRRYTNKRGNWKCFPW